MKTSKSIKVTSIIQIIFCLYCILAVVFITLGELARVKLFYVIGYIMALAVTIDLIIFLVPIVCLCINMAFLFKECGDPEKRKIIGKKWIWMAVMPFVTVACTLLLCLPFVWF